MQEILLDISTTKCVKRPIELRNKTFLTAIRNKLIRVPELRQVHISLSTLSNRHDHFITYLIVPSHRIITVGRWWYVYTITWVSSCYIHPYINNLEETLGLIFIRIKWILCPCSTCYFHWISWEFSQEASCIWVVNHCHFSSNTWSKVNKIHNIVCILWGCACFEDALNILVLGLVRRPLL